jgi:hypothetical protein
MPKEKRSHVPDYGTDVERLVAERDAARAEAARLKARWYERYMPEVEDLIRCGEERGHGWAVGRTGVYSPRTEEEAGPPTREDVMLLAFYGMADEVQRTWELGHEIERLDRKIGETWENARLFSDLRVINHKDRPRPEPSDYVYIGRGLLAGKERFPRSKWANPYTVKRHGRAEALKRYERMIRGGPLWDELPELEGKTLACCCKPERCHGDVLLRLIEERRRTGWTTSTNG